MPSGLQRFILWDYPRAGWQYDLMVGIILTFIFLTPREWFRDQPRASSVVMLQTEHGANVFWIEPDLLSGLSEPERTQKANALLKDPAGKKHRLLRLEPIYDNEREIKGYMAYARP